LTTSDWVLTFNYDTVLEQALERVGLPFRLFPFRFSDVGDFMNTIDDDKDELVLLKLHGSINWFDRASFARHEALGATSPAPYDPKHDVFGKNRVVTPRPLCDGPRPEEEALSNIFIVEDIGPLFTQPFWQWTPLILAPSTAKLFYSMPLRDFWWGWQRSGGMNLGLGFVGYSLPDNDEHARQMVFHIARNYTGFEPDLELEGRRKTPVRILDLRGDDAGKEQLRHRYRFIPSERLQFRWEGLTSEGVEWLFGD
jgi:hypothetical protein